MITRKYAVTAILLGATLTTSAFASDSKSYPGTFCHSHSANGAFVSYVGNAIKGVLDSSSRVVVDCAVVRDNQTSTGITQANFEFFNTATNSNSQIDVEIDSYDEDSNMGTWLDFASDSSVFTGNQQLIVNNLSGPPGSEGTYVANIVLGNDDKLYNLLIIEGD